MVAPLRNVYIQNTLYIEFPKKDPLFRQQEGDKHFRGVSFTLKAQLM